MSKLDGIKTWFDRTVLGRSITRNKEAIIRRRHGAARLIDATMVNIETSRSAAKTMHKAATKIDGGEDGFTRALRQLEKDLGH